MNREINTELQKSLKALNKKQFKILFTIISHYWTTYKFFISSHSFLSLWCELNELCHECDESFPDPHDDHKLIVSYCKEHPYYFIDMLPFKVVQNLFCEHLNKNIDILIEIARKLPVGDLRAVYEYLNEALGVAEDVDEMVAETERFINEF